MDTNNYKMRQNRKCENTAGNKDPCQFREGEERKIQRLF